MGSDTSGQVPALRGVSSTRPRLARQYSVIALYPPITLSTDGKDFWTLWIDLCNTRPGEQTRHLHLIAPEVAMARIARVASPDSLGNSEEPTARQRIDTHAGAASQGRAWGTTANA